MDVTLPQTFPKKPSVSARNVFRSYSYAIPGNFQYSGFYYVGKKTPNIEKLVRLYQRGYASDGIENVKGELLRSLMQEKNVLPEVIICEAHFDFSSIRHFNEFLRNHPVLNSIPFILEASGLSEKELELYKKHTRPDELVFIQNCDEQKLHSKVRFLRKMKEAHSKSRPPRIEESPTRHSFRLGFIFKRGFDILVSSIALLLLSPLFLLIALAIRLESKGPIFYIAKRAGRGYRIFNFYKFRTMVPDADKKIAHLRHMNQYDAENTAKGPVFFKISNDPRITKTGSFLRNTSLDELPQLLNVFLGDMSLVGNRPLPLYEAATLTTDDYAARFLAPAGITGLWQVKKRGNKDMSVQERINMDIDYAEKCSFVTDLWIIANTPSALFQKENV